MYLYIRVSAYAINNGTLCIKNKITKKLPTLSLQKVAGIFGKTLPHQNIIAIGYFVMVATFEKGLILKVHLIQLLNLGKPGQCLMMIFATVTSIQDVILPTPSKSGKNWIFFSGTLTSLLVGKKIMVMNKCSNLFKLM